MLFIIISIILFIIIIFIIIILQKKTQLLSIDRIGQKHQKNNIIKKKYWNLRN